VRVSAALEGLPEPWSPNGIPLVATPKTQLTGFVVLGVFGNPRSQLTLARSNRNQATCS